MKKKYPDGKMLSKKSSVCQGATLATCYFYIISGSVETNHSETWANLRTQLRE